jgi:heat shock 70kDa protein 4
VYDIRSKLEDRYAPFVQPQEKERLLAASQEVEDWLYTEEGENANKSAYVSRLEALHALGDPIASRWRESEQRSKATSQLRETINTFLAQATSGEERFSHIDDKDKESIVERAATVQKWLGDQIAKQAERPKNVDPVLTTEEINKKKEELIYFATPILNKPKPKPKVETPPATNGTQTPQNQDAPEPASGEEASTGPPEMDVD